MTKPCEITLIAGPRLRELCPVPISVEPTGKVGAVHLEELETGAILPAQWDLSGSAPTLIALADTLQPGQNRRFRVKAGASKGRAPGVALTAAHEHVKIKIGGKSFTDYYYSDRWARPFLYPIVGPYGAKLTRGYPMEEIPGECQDHPHHKSIWVAHGEVNGTDNWSEQPGHAWQTHKEFTEIESGPVFGRIAEKLHWTDHDKKEIILNEDRDIRFYALPDDQRLIDFEIKLIAGEKPVLLGDTKEAGFLSVRVATSMDGSGRGQIETGAGAVGERESWGKKAPWCDYSGPVATPWGELWAGIAVFDNPQNLRYPTNWHVRDYGLMTANCFGLHDYFGTKEKPGDYTIPAGESLTFRYRIYIHAGNATHGRVGDKFSDYINPPIAQR